MACQSIHPGSSAWSSLESASSTQRWDERLSRGLRIVLGRFSWRSGTWLDLEALSDHQLRDLGFLDGPAPRLRDPYRD
jgi:hypothetical protein